MISNFFNININNCDDIDEMKVLLKGASNTILNLLIFAEYKKLGNSINFEKFIIQTICGIVSGITAKLLNLQDANSTEFRPIIVDLFMETCKKMKEISTVINNGFTTKFDSNNFSFTQIVNCIESEVKDLDKIIGKVKSCSNKFQKSTTFTDTFKSNIIEDFVKHTILAKRETKDMKRKLLE